jgi:hypothetical protein
MIQLSVKYHIYKKGGVWLVRLKQRDGQVWRNRGVICGGYADIAMAWKRVHHDLDNRQRKRAEALARDARATGSRTEGGRFHGADC